MFSRIHCILMRSIFAYILSISKFITGFHSSCKHVVRNSLVFYTCNSHQEVDYSNLLIIYHDFRCYIGSMKSQSAKQADKQSAVSFAVHVCTHCG